MLKITIGEKQFEYMDSILYEGKTYVAFCDEECITICEYVIEDSNVKIIPIDDVLFSKVKGAMQL